MNVCSKYVYSLHLMEFNNGWIIEHLICHEQLHAGSHSTTAVYYKITYYI